MKHTENSSVYLNYFVVLFLPAPLLFNSCLFRFLKLLQILLRPDSENSETAFWAVVVIVDAVTGFHAPDITYDLTQKIN